MIGKILSGFHIERITDDGRVEILRRSLNSNELILISVNERLPAILSTSKNKRAKEECMWSRILGPRYYRFFVRRLIASNFAYVVLLPQNYTYTNYVLSLPKTTKHYRRFKNFLINGKEIICVKSRGLEHRFHIGPNIGLFINPWINTPCFCLSYINPNSVEDVDFELCLDIAPVEDIEGKKLLQIFQSLETTTKETNLIQEVIDRAYSDSKNPEIKRIEEHVGSFQVAESMLKLIVKNTRILLKKLKRLGIEIQPAGKHQYKAKNPKTGKTAPISWRGEFKPHYVKKICEELQIDYNDLLGV